jgi:hypothetical protein
MHPTEKQYMSIVLEVDTEAKWFSGKSSSTGVVRIHSSSRPYVQVRGVPRAPRKFVDFSMSTQEL